MDFNILVRARNKVYIRLAIPQNFYQPKTISGQHAIPLHYSGVFEYFL